MDFDKVPEYPEGFFPIPAGAPGCDAPDLKPLYWDSYMKTWECRCMVCARCNHHTGNTSQGHYWALCKVTGTNREFHFCCPEPHGCSLEVS